MILKTLRLVLIVTVAGGLPYAWKKYGIAEHVHDVVGPVLPKWSSRDYDWGSADALRFSTPKVLGDPLEWGSVDATNPAGNRADSLSRREAVSRTALEDVLRFDIDDRWITERWPRVSTILAEQNRQGLRVPLVTGIESTDLAGSLSYYLDKHRRVRRISFEGYTGDPSRLIKFATQQFGVHEEPTLKAGLYLARWNAYPTSAIYVRHAPVVRDDAPFTRFEVRFEINRPDAGFALSQEFLAMLDIEWLTRDSMRSTVSPSPIREALLDRRSLNGGP
jgi:hypothetical protein